MKERWGLLGILLQQSLGTVGLVCRLQVSTIKRLSFQLSVKVASVKIIGLYCFCATSSCSFFPSGRVRGWVSREKAIEREERASWMEKPEDMERLKHKERKECAWKAYLGLFHSRRSIIPEEVSVMMTKLERTFSCRFQLVPSAWAPQH